MTSSSATPSNQPTPPPVAATIHIYRGLMDTASTWRTRIDNPTNWAIITSGTTVSFVLSDEEHPHAVLLLVMLMTVMFMIVEARRTRFYDVWGSWLRLLETEYFAPILQDNCVTINDTWQELIVRDLSFPHFKTTFWQMLGRRLRDNYLAIYLFLILSWLVKLVFHHPIPSDMCLQDTYICHAAVGPIPGWTIVGGVFCFYLGLLMLMFVTYHVAGPSVEVLSRESTLRKLVSPAQQPVHKRRWHPEAYVETEHHARPSDLED
jgi:uncharacterized membrane protein